MLRESSGKSPTRLLRRRRLSASLSRRCASEKEVSSSPLVISAAMRRSSSASWSTAMPDWRMNALRVKISRPIPSSISPQFSPVKEGTASSVPVYTARKRPIGALARAVSRVMVISRPSSVQRSTRPCIGEPLHGAYRFLSASAPRSRVESPKSITRKKAHQVDLPLSFGASIMFSPSESVSDAFSSAPKVADIFRIFTKKASFFVRSQICFCTV